MYFWGAAIMSFIFSFGLLFISVKGLVQNASKENLVDGKKIDKTVKDFSTISDNFSSILKDTKAFIYDISDKTEQEEAKLKEEQLFKDGIYNDSLNNGINIKSENIEDKKPNILPTE